MTLLQLKGKRSKSLPAGSPPFDRELRKSGVNEKILELRRLFAILIAVYSVFVGAVGPDAKFKILFNLQRSCN